MWGLEICGGLSAPGPFEVTSEILVTEQAPIMKTMVPAQQCATLLLSCAPLPFQGSKVSVPLFVQSTSVGALMLVLGTFMPPGSRAPITMQGPAFPPIARAPMLFQGAQTAPE